MLTFAEKNIHLGGGPLNFSVSFLNQLPGSTPMSENNKSVFYERRTIKVHCSLTRCANDKTSVRGRENATAKQHPNSWHKKTCVWDIQIDMDEQTNKKATQSIITKSR